MRILYKNELYDASLPTPVGINFRYPLANILHPSIRIRFEASSSEVIITASWDADVSINCVGFSGSNAYQVRVTLKNSDGLDEERTTFANTKETDILYMFQTHSNIRTALIRFWATSDVQVGYLSVGSFLQAPDPLINYNINPEDTSLVNKQHGFVSGVEGEMLRGISGLQFYNVSKETVDAFNNLLRVSFTYRPLFVDMTEYNRDASDVLYGHLVKPFNVSRYSRGTSKWTISGVDFEEMR